MIDAIYSRDLFPNQFSIYQLFCETNTFALIYSASRLFVQFAKLQRDSNNSEAKRAKQHDLVA